MPAHDIRVNFDTSTLGHLQPAGMRMRDTVPYYGGDVDAVAPTVTVISPAVDTDITPDTELIVDVQDEDRIAFTCLLVTFAGWGHTEAIYNGSAFLAPYTGGGSVPSSSVEVISPGTHLRFHLRRFGGWPGAVTMTLAPVDGGGNLPDA